SRVLTSLFSARRSKAINLLPSRSSTLTRCIEDPTKQLELDPIARSPTPAACAYMAADSGHLATTVKPCRS
ncbi:MAG TPA: hypothetical protein VGK53_16910, partial [Propionicimonas sp.]